MAARRKAPPGTYWRGTSQPVLWGRIVVKGREIRWSLRTGDVEVARGRYEARRQREIAASHYGDERKTWDDAVLAWTDHIIGNVGPATIKRYAVSLGQAEPDLKGCYLDEIDKGVISGFVRRRKRTASNATIRRDLVAISSVLAYCEDEEWIDANPALARLRRLKERRDPIVLPEAADIAAVIERAPGNFARLIEAALTTGARQAELVGLQRHRLDHGRRQLTVLGKGNRQRTIDMLDAYDVLRRTPAHVRGQHVFWHDDGEPYRNVSARFAAITGSAREAAQRAGRRFRRFRFHDLRHRFAVDYLKTGGSLYTLQQHLGHRSVKTTEIYLQFLTPEEAAHAKLGSAQMPAQA